MSQVNWSAVTSRNLIRMFAWLICRSVSNCATFLFAHQWMNWSWRRKHGGYSKSASILSRSPSECLAFALCLTVLVFVLMNIHSFIAKIYRVPLQGGLL